MTQHRFVVSRLGGDVIIVAAALGVGESDPVEPNLLAQSEIESR